MTLIAMALIVTSAFLHAVWNFVSKRGNPSLAFFFVAACSAAIIISPLPIVHHRTLPLIPMFVWPLILATGIAQTIYFFGLAGAYKRGDISLAYPLARALPVLLIASISLMIGKRAEIGLLGLLGMVFITFGCVVLPLPNFQKMQPRAYLNIVTLMALIAAVGTTGYTLIDDQALRQLRNTSAIALSNSEITLLFVSLQTVSTAVMLGIGTALVYPERQQLKGVLRNRSLFTAGLVTGIVMMTTYGLVLASMVYVTNVSYVAAFRQLSIPIGAVLGLTLQHEPRYLPKLVGIGIVSVGLILVGTG